MYSVGHKRGNLGWWIAAFIVLIIIGLSGGGRWPLALFRTVTAPVQGLLAQAGAAVKDYQSRHELTTENIWLRQQLTEKLVDAAQLNSLEIENQLLHEELNFLEPMPYQFVTARVIAGSGQSGVSVVTINRGSGSGIAVGQPVITGEGILVGRIATVEQSAATVLLLSDSRSTIAATIQNRDRTIGIVQGAHGISVQLDMIPQDEPVTSGDIVVTAGGQEHIPGGLLIGAVDTVDTHASELFARAFLFPMVDYRTLTVVTILIDKTSDLWLRRG